MPPASRKTATQPASTTALIRSRVCVMPSTLVRPRQRPSSQRINYPGTAVCPELVRLKAAMRARSNRQVATAQSALNYLGDEGARVVAVLRSRSYREEVLGFALARSHRGGLP